MDPLDAVLMQIRHLPAAWPHQTVTVGTRQLVTLWPIAVDVALLNHLIAIFPEVKTALLSPPTKLVCKTLIQVSKVNKPEEKFGEGIIPFQIRLVANAMERFLKFKEQAALSLLLAVEDTESRSPVAVLTGDIVKIIWDLI